MKGKYETPLAFKTALEDRLRSEARKAGGDVARLRQLLVFERFLVRVFTVLPKATVLKGGFALELRLARARTTNDVDLRTTRSNTPLLDRLQQAARVELEDGLTFEVREDPRQPAILAIGLPYGGGRFQAEGRIAGRLYGSRFGVDVAIGEPLVGEPESLQGSSLLRFIGVEAPVFRVVPLETHVAEKLHAYTLPRERPNSRVKDLPDIALLSTIRQIERISLARAFRATFQRRGTHPIPEHLPEPPAGWARPYARMAQLNSLPWRTLEDVYGAAREFLDPLLGKGGETWNPRTRSWR